LGGRVTTTKTNWTKIPSKRETNRGSNFGDPKKMRFGSEFLEVFATQKNKEKKKRGGGRGQKAKMQKKLERAAAGGKLPPEMYNPKGHQKKNQKKEGKKNVPNRNFFWDPKTTCA